MCRAEMSEAELSEETFQGGKQGKITPSKGHEYHKYLKISSG